MQVQVSGNERPQSDMIVYLSIITPTHIPFPLHEAICGHHRWKTKNRRMVSGDEETMEDGLFDSDPV